MKRILLVLFLAAALLSGCVDGSFGQDASFHSPQSVTFAGQGQFRGDVEQKRIDCDADGTFTVGAQGDGDLEITVTDGAGKEIGRFEIHGSAQKGDSQQIRGANGTWTVTVTTGHYDMMPFVPPAPRAYNGQYGGSVTC